MSLQELPFDELILLRYRVNVEIASRRKEIWLADPSELPVTVREVVARIASERALAVSDVLGPSRCRNVAEARWAIWAILRKRGYSFPRIGQLFGRDHTTVIHGVRRLREMEHAA